MSSPRTCSMAPIGAPTASHSPMPTIPTLPLPSLRSPSESWRIISTISRSPRPWPRPNPYCKPNSPSKSTLWRTTTWSNCAWRSSALVWGAKGSAPQKRVVKGEEQGSASNYCMHHCVHPIMVVRYPNDKDGLCSRCEDHRQGGAAPHDPIVESHPWGGSATHFGQLWEWPNHPHSHRVVSHPIH